MSATDVTVPYGYCHCGCGARTARAKQSDTARGYVRGEPCRFRQGHYSRVSHPHLPQYEARDCGHGTPCWIWTAAINPDGYGTWGRYGAHRRMWDRAGRPPVPEGWQLDHVCRNRACVNPDHLEPVPPRINTWRRLATKLTPADALAVRLMALTTSVPDIAVGETFGVSQQLVSRIKLGQIWTYLWDAERAVDDDDED